MSIPVMPSDFSYGKVVGLFLLGVADTSDADRLPNPKAASGIITFSSATPMVKTNSPSAAVGKEAIPCTVGPDGYLVDQQNNPGVWLFTGVWTVSYNLPGLPIQTHQIEVLATHTDAAPLDLVQAAPPGSQPVTPTEYAELSARIDAIGSPSDAAVAGYVATPATQTRNALEADFAQIDDPRFGTISPQLTEDVAKGVKGYNFQTGKTIFDWRGAAATARTVSLSTSMVEFLVDATNTGNQTVDLAVDTDSIVGRVVVFHVPQYNFRIKFHATNVVVENWPKDVYREIWGTMVFEDDNKWHVIGSTVEHIKGTNIDVYGMQEKLTVNGTYNVLVGYDSGHELTDGDYNVAIGLSAQYSLTTGLDNIGIGRDAGVLWNKATINETIAIGKWTSVAVAGGIAIGANADVLDTHTNSIAFGAGVQTNAADQLAIGPRDLEIQSNGVKGVVLRSANGTRYRITVSDAGVLGVAVA